MQYRNEIDGLRALAVLPVVLFHFNSDWLPGGYIGVDVFFVISGYLITSIIMEQYYNDDFSLLSFWIRRIRRIFPALLVMVFATLVVGKVILYGPDLNNLGDQGFASLLSFSNISHLLLAGDYWGHDAEASPLLHTWSLSVEEQYYLFFPLLFLLLLRKSLKLTVVVLSFLTVASYSIYQVGLNHHPTLTFYVLPTRAWELGVGVLIALARNVNITTKVNHVLAPIGLVLIVGSYFYLGNEDGLTSYLLVPVIGVALIIKFAEDKKNIANQLLSFSPFVYVGKISYSLYLWHWPILVYFYQSPLLESNGINIVTVASLILLVSIVSYHFVEKPAKQNERTFVFVLTGLLAALSLALYLKFSSANEDVSMFDSTAWHGNLYSVNPDQNWSKSARKRLTGVTLYPSDPDNAVVYSTGGIQHLYGTNQPEIVIIGDSHALMWGKVFDEIAEETSTSISFYSADGTPPFFKVPPIPSEKDLRYFTVEEKLDFDLARMEYLTKWKPKVVVLASRWEKQNLVDVEGLVRFVGELGSKILLINQPPVLYFGNRNAPQYLSYSGIVPSDGVKQYVATENSLQFKSGSNIVNTLADRYEFVISVDVAEIYTSGKQAWAVDSKKVLYVDEDHLSYAGALKAKHKIHDAVFQLLESSNNE